MFYKPAERSLIHLAVPDKKKKKKNTLCIYIGIYLIHCKICKNASLGEASWYVKKCLYDHLSRINSK